MTAAKLSDIPKSIGATPAEAPVATPAQPPAPAPEPITALVPSPSQPLVTIVTPASTEMTIVEFETWMDKITLRDFVGVLHLCQQRLEDHRLKGIVMTQAKLDLEYFVAVEEGPAA